MKITKTPIDDLLILEANLFMDEREDTLWNLLKIPFSKNTFQKLILFKIMESKSEYGECTWNTLSNATFCTNKIGKGN